MSTPSGLGAIHAPTVQRQPLAVRFLLMAGLVSPLIFVVVVLVDGATPPGYNPWHHPMSTLALGPHGWVMTIAFVVLGAGLLCFAVGLRRFLNSGRGSTWGPILIAVVGVSLIGLAIFPTDPALGYPPGAASTSTLHGFLHSLLSGVFGDLPMVAACIVLTRRFAQAPGGRPWVLYSIATVILVVVFQVLGAVAYVSSDPGSPYGFLQRLEFFTELGWVAALAARLLVGTAFEPEPAAR
ncbi:MAG: DUF998 domain-containing protein [Nocardiopsaceae bacterium]|jgi:hypothetical membrane protein|nr:DUF998 domain-containing protein [Nocardiopsaceae bacterium]